MQTNRLPKEKVGQLYIKLLAKSATSKLYKQHKITPMYLVEHPEQATAFKNAVEAEMKELDNKHKMANVNLDWN